MMKKDEGIFNAVITAISFCAFSRESKHVRSYANTASRSLKINPKLRQYSFNCMHIAYLLLTYIFLIETPPLRICSSNMYYILHSIFRIWNAPKNGLLMSKHYLFPK